MPLADEIPLNLTDFTCAPWAVAVLDNLREGVLIERSEHVMYANRAYASLLGFDDVSQLIGTPIHRIIAADDQARLLSFTQRRVREEPAPLRYTFNACRNDGSRCRLTASVSTIRLGDETLIATVVRPIHMDEADVPVPHLSTLSDRERQVMRMLLCDKRPKQIAFELEISEKTVATHRKRLYDKLGFRNAQDLFRYAVQHDLVEWS